MSEARKAPEPPKELAKEEIEYHAALANLLLHNYNEALPQESPKAAVEWQYGACTSFTATGGVLTLQMNAYAPPGQPITVPFSFLGLGGFAPTPLGGGVAWGTFWCLIDHNVLAGDVTFGVEVTPATITAQFFRGGNLIGHFVGGGPSLGWGGGGGTGKFTV